VNDCVFCDILVGKAPAEFVATSGGWAAFRPLDPHVPGHVLFVPRRHVERADHAPEVTGRVFAAAAQWAWKRHEHFNLLTSAGRHATQTVPHLHVHLIPRGPGEDENLEEDWPWLRQHRP
jgi:histidine triad (HIT) family protein